MACDDLLSDAFNGLRATQDVCTALAQSDVLDHPRLQWLAQCLHNYLNWYARVDSMLVIKVVVLRPETLEGALESIFDVGRCGTLLAIAELAFRIVRSEFGGEENLAPTTCLREPFGKT